MPHIKREFNVFIKRDFEGYDFAGVLELSGCQMQARLLNKPLRRIQEAIELCLEVNDGDLTSLGHAW